MCKEFVKMIIIIGFIIIVIGTTIAIIRSKKPVAHILAEAKYELQYNSLGMKALLSDYVMKGKNKTGTEIIYNNILYAEFFNLDIKHFARGLDLQ